MSETEKKKSGKLSLIERSFIEENCGKLTITQIAERLNRHKEPIEKYIRQNSLTYVRAGEDSLYGDLRTKLRERLYWKELEKQLTDDELVMFESMWLDLMRQFKENVLATEEYQMKQLITIEILMNRSMRNRRDSILDIERYQRLIDKEYEKEEDIRDWAKIDNCNTQISLAKAAQQGYTTEHSKLAADAQKLFKDLKATRDQRLAKIEENKTTFMGLIKYLEDQEVQEREGYLAGLVKKSIDKTYSKYSQLHKYHDKIIDLPILNGQTIQDYTEEELNKKEKDNDEYQEEKSSN